MNTLMPFNLKGLTTTEAVYPMPGMNPLKAFRMTRKGWGEFFGAENPRTYIGMIKQRHPELPEGVDIAVISTDGKKYVTTTLDIIEIHPYAVYSDLLRAKQFLLIFPELQQRLMRGEISFPVPDPSLQYILSLPKYSKERKQASTSLAIQEGKSYVQITRDINKFEKGIPLKKPFKPKDPDKFKAARKIMLTTIKSNAKIALELRISGSTIGRWRTKI